MKTKFHNSVQTIKTTMTLLTGAALGVATVLSCSDESPPRADAAACDCAPAEPPLAGRIVEIVSTVRLSPANVGPAFGKGAAPAQCPLNATLISGGCAANLNQTPDIVVEQSYPVTDSGTGWVCVWKNGRNEETPVRAFALCLVPAST